MELLEYKDAGEEVKAIYDDIKNSLGFSEIPNFFKAQGKYVLLLKSSWQMVKQILVKAPHVNRIVKEIILVGVSRSTNCKYCESAHIALCEILDYKSMLNEKQKLPERSAALVEIAIISTIEKDSKRGKELCEKWQVYDQEKMELIAMGALSLYLNAIADSLEVPIDDGIIKTVDRVNQDKSMQHILSKLDKIVSKMQKIDLKLDLPA